MFKTFLTAFLTSFLFIKMQQIVVVKSLVTVKSQQDEDYVLSPETLLLSCSQQYKRTSTTLDQTNKLWHDESVQEVLSSLAALIYWLTHDVICIKSLRHIFMLHVGRFTCGVMPAVGGKRKNINFRVLKMTI